MYQGSVNIKLREVFYMYIRGRTRTLFMSKSLKHYTPLCDLWSQIKISSQLFTEEQLISWISYLFPLHKNFSSANKAADKYKCMYLVNKKDITQCWFGRIEFVSVYLGRNHSFAITTTVGQKLMDKVICKLALGRMWYPRNR